MPAALIAAPLAALLLQATPETLADLQRAFDQTCNSRIYGQFDDMCSAMEAQVQRYRAELKHRPSAAKPPPPAPAPDLPSPPPAATQAPPAPVPPPGG